VFAERESFAMSMVTNKDRQNVIEMVVRTILLDRDTQDEIKNRMIEATAQALCNTEAERELLVRMYCMARDLDDRDGN
jgi:hypothetical protein